MKTIIALVLALSAPVALAQQGKIEITRADVDVAAGMLFVHGQGFGTQPATVVIDRSVLDVQSHSPTDLVAALPQGIESGTYRLVVVRAPGNASASMDVTIGSGETLGSAGPMGPAGPTGPQGPVGPAGATGPQGPRGEPGPRGPTGPQGEQGLAGQIGPMGPAGPQGEQGLAGQIGPMGPAGPQGEQGLAGKTGPMGPAGLSGLEQISLAQTVSAGTTGTQEVVAACPSGKKAIAGGARSAIPNAFYGTHPTDDGRNWIGEFRRLSSPYEGKAWVICAVIAE